jgi:glycosyltransferase involved in cell wall biosynthesis
MFSVLINAYAVSPNHGSEAGMGWNWISNIANYCLVHVITEGEWRNEIVETVKNLPQGRNMHFYYISVSESIRKMCWNQGDWRFYYHYHKWQKKALTKAKEICANEHIDVLHQLNMIGYREPGLLWKIKDIPLIWGPVGGFGSIPFNFSKEFGIKGAFKQVLKNFLNKIQLYQPNIYRAITKSRLILAAYSESMISLQRLRKERVILLNETGSGKIIQIDKDFYSDTLSLIWIGKNVNRKALPIALKTMKCLTNYSITLKVIGVDISSVNPSLLEGLSNVRFYPWIPHHEVQEHLEQSHILLFTSLHEGTPHVVIEALTKGLPVICHDICGQGDSIYETNGIKVNLINPEKSVEGFAKAILKLYEDRSLLNQLSQGAYLRAREISWEKKSLRLFKYYEELCANSIHYVLK